MNSETLIHLAVSAPTPSHQLQQLNPSTSAQKKVKFMKVRTKTVVHFSFWNAR